MFNHAQRTRRALMGLSWVAAAMAAHAQAATLDFSAAVKSTGPAGTIGVGVLVDGSPMPGGNGSWVRVVSGSPNTTTPIGTGLTSPVAASAGGGLTWQANPADATFGVSTATFNGRPLTLTSNIQLSKGLWTDLQQPAATGFHFEWSGTSASAADQVNIGLGSLNAAGQSFSNTISHTGAGAWTLAIDTPLGWTPAQFNFMVGGTGNSSLSSFTVKPQLSAVPEPASLALMGLGLSVLLATSKRRGPAVHRG
ncbi:MAG: hypothetical protein RI907_952 [Pseudomonadota bacterium]